MTSESKGWALILGASSGFGGATSLELAREARRRDEPEVVPVGIEDLGEGLALPFPGEPNAPGHA